MSGDSALIIVCQTLLSDLIINKIMYSKERIGISHYNKTDGVKLSDKDTNTK